MSADWVARDLITRSSHRMGAARAGLAKQLFPTHCRIDDNPFAYDQTFDQLEFEIVISGLCLAGRHRQQFGASLNIWR